MYLIKIEIWEIYNLGIIVCILVCDSLGIDVDRGMIRWVRGRGLSFINLNVYLFKDRNNYLFIYEIYREGKEGR